MGVSGAPAAGRRAAILPLEDFAALTVSGEDRRDFLQGQISQDLQMVSAGQAAPAAWCNRQGRVLCVMAVMEWGDAMVLALPAEMAGTCAAGLGRYILRARVRIEAAQAPVFGCVDANALFASRPQAWQCSAAPGYCAVRLPGDGNRALLIGEPPDTLAQAADTDWTAERWRLADIEAEIPWIGPQTTAQFLAHSLNLDLSGAVSFTKGCYVGQEIIARMEYRGTPKRRMQRVRLPGDAGATPGAKLDHPELGAITIISTARHGEHNEALAEVRQMQVRPGDKDQR